MAAFESVGAILVISMLIVPAATARLLTDRLGVLLFLSLIVAALSAGLGHVGAIVLPSMIFSRLGYPDVQSASTTGMMAVASGLFFVLAILISPRHGMIRHLVDRIRLQIRIAGEDMLGALYRKSEASLHPQQSSVPEETVSLAKSLWIQWLGRKQLYRQGLITDESTDVAMPL